MADEHDEKKCTKKIESIDFPVRIKDKQDNAFPSSKILLSVIQKEYDYEANRAKNLEARTGMFLAFTGVLLVFIASNIKLSTIYMIKITNVLQALPYAIIVFTTLSDLLCLIIAVIFFVMVISLKPYKRLSMGSFSEESLCKIRILTEEQVAVSLVALYRDVIQYNTEINNKKAGYFTTGIKYLLAGLIVTVFTYILFSFMV